MSCGCVPGRHSPQAIIVADTGNMGGISRIRNVSIWNETPWANLANRQVKWHLFKNGYEVIASPQLPFTAKIDFAGVRHTPSVSDGDKLNFEDATADVIRFLESKYIVVLPNDRLEIGLEIVNGNNEKSDLSNLIILPRGVNDSCCDGMDNYLFVIGKVDHCALVTVGGFDYCLTTPVLN